MADLVTLAEYKAYKGITSTTQDAQIAALITKVSKYIRTYIDRELTTYFDEPLTQYFDGGAQNLPLKEVPVQTVQSVEISSDYGRTYTALVEYTDYVVSKTKETVECPFLADGFPYALNGYRVTYTGGYESVPDDIKLASLDLVAYYLQSDMSIKSTRNVGANTTSIEYITTASLPSHIRRILDLYRLELV